MKFGIYSNKIKYKRRNIMGDGIAKAVIGSVGVFSYWSSMLCYKKWVAIMGIIFIGTSY